MSLCVEKLLLFHYAVVECRCASSNYYSYRRAINGASKNCCFLREGTIFCGECVKSVPSVCQKYAECVPKSRMCLKKSDFSAQ